MIRSSLAKEIELFFLICLRIKKLLKYERKWRGITRTKIELKVNFQEADTRVFVWGRRRGATLSLTHLAQAPERESRETVLAVNQHCLQKLIRGIPLRTGQGGRGKQGVSKATRGGAGPTFTYITISKDQFIFN